MDRDALAVSRRPLVRTDFLRTDRLAGSGEIPCRHTEACALCRQNDEMGEVNDFFGEFNGNVINMTLKLTKCDKIRKCD